MNKYKLLSFLFIEIILLCFVGLGVCLALNEVFIAIIFCIIAIYSSALLNTFLQLWMKTKDVR